MFVGVKGQGAFSLPLKEGGAETPISVSSIHDAADASFTEVGFVCAENNPTSAI